MIGIIYSNNNTAVTNAVSQKNGAFHGPRVHVLPADLGGQVSIRLLTAMGLWDENDLKHIETTFRKIQTKVDKFAMRAHPVGRFFSTSSRRAR